MDASALGMHESDLNAEFFQRVVASLDSRHELLTWTEQQFDSGTHGIVTALLGDQTNVKDKRVLGFRCFTLESSSPSGALQTKTVVLKSKTTGQRVAEVFRDSCMKLGGEILRGYERYYQHMGLLNSEHRDVITMTIDEPALNAIRPKVYHHIYSPDDEVFAYVMDDFRSVHYSHLNTVGLPWSATDVSDVLCGIARLHARFYARTRDVPDTLARWMDNAHALLEREEMQFIWQAMRDDTHRLLPCLVNSHVLRLLRIIAANRDVIVRIIHASPHTLIHNDLNNRNLCFEVMPTSCTTSPASSSAPPLSSSALPASSSALPASSSASPASSSTHATRRLCVYDWEMVSFGCPQHDVSEFLAFTLPVDASVETWLRYRDIYHDAFRCACARIGVEIETDASTKDAITKSLAGAVYEEVFDMCVLELLYVKLMMCCTTCRFVDLPYMPTVMTNVATYANYVVDKYGFVE